jgi:hypothetical protein
MFEIAEFKLTLGRWMQASMEAWGVRLVQELVWV